ncbi:MAG: hypothetical protein AAF399_13310 [Bacteroidota bacterium]
MKIFIRPFRASWLAYLGLILTVALFIGFPLHERALFAHDASLYVADAIFVLFAVLAGRQLIRGVRDHFASYRKDISAGTVFFLQFSVSLFTWLILAFPLAYTFFEGVHGAAVAESGLFRSDVALATLLFALWAAIGCAYPLLPGAKEKPANQLVMADSIS